MFEVMQGDERVLPYLYHLDQFVRCEAMLKWLIANRLTGKEFISWANFHFGVSILEMARFILMQLDKEKERRPVIAGKDILLYERY